MLSNCEDYKELIKKIENNNNLGKIKITLDTRLLNDEDFDFFHYQQSYELAKCDYGTFYIASRGELKCDYYDDNGEWVDNALDTIQNCYVRNNKEFLKAIENGNLYLDCNNWFSIELIDNNNHFVELFDYLDNVYGSISECLNGLYDIITDKDFINEVIEEIKSNDNN